MIDYKKTGIGVIDAEIEALQGLKKYINDDFTEAVNRILKCTGKIVVTGMGKSGHIGSKIAATMASTGTPAFFIHPGEASHGDLGMISANDLIIAISNSGETAEILTILPIIKRRGIQIIGMSGNEHSTLAKYSDVHLTFRVEREACPLNLAPTSSTTATLALGDALAVTLLEARGFTERDFAMSHPGGALGRKLLTRVEDIMHKGAELPIINQSALLRDAILEMNSKGLGMVAITDDNQKLCGVFTDGDLRRAINNVQECWLSRPITDVIKPNCITVKADILAAEAVKIMSDRKINGLLVIDDDNHLIGAFNTVDLMHKGII